MRKICSEAQNCLKTNTIDGCRPIEIRPRFVSRLVLHRVKKYLLYFYIGFFLFFHLYIIIIIWKEKAKATSNVVVLSVSPSLTVSLLAVSRAFLRSFYKRIEVRPTSTDFSHRPNRNHRFAFFSSSFSSLTHRHHRRVLVHFSIS